MTGTTGRLIAAALIAAVVTMANNAFAANSRDVIPFQGAVAVKPGQAPLDSSAYPFRFEIFSAATGGTKVYDEDRSLTIVNGVFTVELGGGSEVLPASIFSNNPDLWLQITIDTNRNSSFETSERILPRTHLGAAPYAFRAHSAASVDAVSTLREPTTFRDAAGALFAQLTAAGALILDRDLASGSAPPRGAIFRNNVCLAWGIVSANGDLVSGYGIRSTNYDDDNFSYEVELSNPVVLLNNQPLYSVVVTAIGTAQFPEICTYEPISSTRIGVQFVGLDTIVINADRSYTFEAVQSAFSITVFGQQAR